VGTRVAEQVGEHLVQHVLVAGDDNRLGWQVEQPVVAGASYPGVAGCLDSQLRQVHRFVGQRATRIEPREQQQVVDQPAHPLGLGPDPDER
jgi:hypothetical protein